MASTDIRGIPLEVAVFDPVNAVRAENIGAHRVQINAKDSHAVGGLTPSIDFLKTLHKPTVPGVRKLEIPVRIHIRPRPAPGPDAEETQDYIYSDDEFEQMRDAITEFKALETLNPIRGDAFVFGILKREGDGEGQVPGRLVPDFARCSQLVNHALPIRCCFGRAFDAVATLPTLARNLRELTILGFTGVLTAGGPGATMLDNMDNLVEVCNTTDSIQIVAGGGVHSSNVKKLLSRLKSLERRDLWVHSACHYLPDEKLSEGMDPEMVSTVEVAALRRECGIVDPEWFSPQVIWRQLYH